MKYKYRIVEHTKPGEIFYTIERYRNWILGWNPIPRYQNGRRYPVQYHTLEYAESFVEQLILNDIPHTKKIVKEYNEK